MPVRVFHGDDSESYRLLIRETLPEQGGIVVVGSADTADGVVDGVTREQPDVVLLDQMAGADLVDRVRAAVPDVRVVVLSGWPAEAADPALVAAADAYVEKVEPLSALAAAVRGG